MLPDPQDGLPAGLECPCQGRHARTLSELARDLRPLFAGETGRPAEPPAFRPRSAQPGLGPLDQEIALEFRDRVDHGHRQLARRTRQVDPTQRQAVDPHAEFLELGDGRTHVHGIAAESVELGHHQNVARLEPVEQAGEPAALPDRGGSRDGLGHEAARLDGEPSGLDLGELIVGGLAGGRDAEVSEGARHEAVLSENLDRNWTPVRNLQKLGFEQDGPSCPEPVGSGHPWQAGVTVRAPYAGHNHHGIPRTSWR